ncbi:glycine cleavage system T-protein-like,folate-binding protein, aminomethyltransferase-like protein [Spiribacter salinus M19-40]|uniref:Glycine cleavage system T-protein-like,folate-binding protein, aminomethyltransferase-like protein n=1 Tax=Spiribacter salinus M19-40 TaxID=1260251 RepID=R4V3C1_9GAMM|nr:glycine cleavage T C-terminal barrel domain-containing protein [Spiribacter salinus]AGM40509.1 glycine cleavage system T-protein-like,folate-binding protein, aminomethyltransferase-like protein [Spiribacter salinus M19-40]
MSAKHPHVGVNDANVTQVTSVDQSGRKVPINLRQSGRTPVEMLISTRVRKSPYWHLAHQAGCWRATVYNRMYHPRGYVRPEDGGAMVEYDALVNHVTMWNVAVERQIQVKGPDAEAFVNYVITRDATRIKPMHGKYVILCNEAGGILNDPVLLRISEDEFWFSLSDSDLELWMRGVNIAKGFDVTIAEIDVAPVQIQGPKSEDLMADLFGEAVREIPYYGLMAGQVAGRDVIISQTGFTGEKGYEIYLRDATRYAEDMWNTVLEVGKKHQLMVIAPAHHRRIAAGILSWGQDIDMETLPFQCNLAYQVPRNKAADYIGKQALEAARARLEAGDPPFHLKMVGLTFGGLPITDYAPDFWLVAERGADEAVGYISSPWYSPELETNIALAWVPVNRTEVGTALEVWLPDEYTQGLPGNRVNAEVVSVPFRPSVNPNAREVASTKGLDYAE